jgi:hypothetical protein
MLTSFPLLFACGLTLRCSFDWGLNNRLGLGFTVPQILAGALIVLAGLPDLFLRRK